eukprot:CAMPEP_0181503776 /NCGR_PEP_ID=MMETSP1110-20121109/57118_1 /TAXON_ID=174948 /ORGANISM="Symbiodinium sp., Strain CCMP421" /LENGTH=1070 /DNA_ID=CAMNT_0023632543 /DNA_START=35 /DNA_END=3247 /DNA_ORIENTATION=+
MDESPLAVPYTPQPCSRTVSRWSFKSSAAVISPPNNQLRPPYPHLLRSYLRPGDASSRSCSPATTVHREYLDRGDSDSIMGEVQDRIREMEARMNALEADESVMLSQLTAHSGATGRSGWTGDSTRGDELRARKKRCRRVPFRPAVIMTVALGALLACVLMFLPLFEFTTQLQTKTGESYQRSIDRQFQLIEALTGHMAVQLHRNILERISGMLWDTVLEPPNRAIDAMWGTMQTMHAFDPSWNGTTATQRAAISHRALLELKEQQSPECFWSRSGAADFIYVGFESGEFAGSTYRCVDRNCSDVAASWWDCEGSPEVEQRFREMNVTHWDPNCGESFPTQRPWFKLQSAMAELGGPLKRLWSGLYLFVDGNIGFTKTSPVAYCGDYSCFQGVVSADITLPVVSRGCSEAFDRLKKELNATAYSFPINRSNAAVFVVSHVSRGGQEGLLVGSSGSNGRDIVLASESPEALVHSTAEALLGRFGRWDAEALKEQQLFRYRLGEENLTEDCGSSFSDITGPNCLQVGTLSVQLDEVDRWLVVIVSPALAFYSMAKTIESHVLEEFEVMDANMDMMGVTILQSAGFAFLVTTVLTMGLGVCLGTAVSSPLRELTGLLRRLGDLDFSTCLQARAPSSIHDICEVQDAFCRLSKGLETFARFVPEAVVRNIIKGDCRASRLHVTKREVSIMFSDIKDFTSLSESLKQNDLIFLLTRYLSIMSRIVETFGGVVAEILGDGLLVYWNTPLDVEDHPIKACAAAVAMQQALGPLNLEMSECSLPSLSVRIGINSGQVLSGTFGSDKKMKFGCMGDPVNLASRLEGLCKVYGVGIICAGPTHDWIADAGGFICRKLDLVQVKGRQEAVTVYEIMGCDFNNVGAEPISESVEMSLESSPRRRGDEVCKTNSRDSKGTAGSRLSQVSKPSRVSELLKSPSQAALDALEESRQSLTQLDGFNWQQVLEHKQDRTAARKMRLGSSNPTSPVPVQSSGFVSSLVTPDVDKLQELARRYEMALGAYQGARFEEAFDLAEVLLVDFSEDQATQRLSNIAYAKLPEVAKTSSSKGPWNAVTVMVDKE